MGEIDRVPAAYLGLTPQAHPLPKLRDREERRRRPHAEPESDIVDIHEEDAEATQAEKPAQPPVSHPGLDLKA